MLVDFDGETTLAEGGCKFFIVGWDVPCSRKDEDCWKRL